MSAQRTPPSLTLCTCGNPLQVESLTLQLPDYSYAWLSAKSSFRIFTLAPGLEAEPVRGTLREMFLAEHSPDSRFNALSYTWSGAAPMPERNPAPKEPAQAFAWETVQKPHTIVVDEASKMAVTCSVYSALLRLRSTSVGLPIFVDAICIDQGSSPESLNERASQVRRMGDIYRNAQIVFIDFGDQDDGAVDVLFQIHEFAALEDATWAQARTSADEFLHIVPQTLISSMTLKSWLSLIALCTRRWWTRLWIIQEVMLAARAIVFVNRETIDHDILMKGLRRIWDYWCIYPYLIEVHDVVIPDYGTARRINQHCTTPCRHFSNLLEWTRTSPGFFSNFRPSYLLMLMATTPVLESVIPHDQIYALLGLVRHEESDTLLVDYSLPYQAVLVSFSTYVVRKSQIHKLLHLLSAQDADLPTWVLDPTTRNVDDDLDTSVFFANTAAIFHASGTETAKTSFDESGMLLSIDGILFGTIGASTESLSPFADDVDWQHFCNWCLDARNLYSSHQVKPTSSPIDDFWATICIGGRLMSRPGMDVNKLAESAHAFDASLESNAGPPNYEAIRFVDYALGNCSGRRFAMTEEGYPALVRGRVQPGDNVAVFMGCPIPFVIRPTTRGTYRFVGSAYVHGFMDGEALQLDQTHRKTFVLE